MADETKPPTLPTVLWTLANLVFKREALMLLAAMALLVGAGGASVVYGQGFLDGGMERRLVPVELKQAATDAEVAALKVEMGEVKKQVANVERLGLETNLNVRLMLESRGIKPIDVPRLETDAGR